MEIVSPVLIAGGAIFLLLTGFSQIRHLIKKEMTLIPITHSSHFSEHRYLTKRNVPLRFCLTLLWITAGRLIPFHSCCLVYIARFKRTFPSWDIWSMDVAYCILEQGLLNPTFMAWVFKSLWDFAAGDWQEGQVYHGFSLVTSFHIQLHSSSSKGLSSWQPPSLFASAGMPVAGRRMCCIPRPTTQPHCNADMAAAPAHQVRPPSDGASATLIYPGCRPEVLTLRDAEHLRVVSRSHSQEYAKNRACWIQVSFCEQKNFPVLKLGGK